MATRSDISVLWNLSPRLIAIASPSAEITIQDLHDTLKNIEDEPGAMQYPSLITTAGKENLGGGVSVGLTATLLNAQIMFERRTVILNQGTITTASTPGSIIQVIDSAADFVSSGVKPGDFVANTTDQGVGEVLEIISPTELRILSPTGGIEDDFDVGEAYNVYYVVECSISGGNVVAIDADGSSINALFPSFGTYAVRTSSSSATFQQSEDIQYSSFGGGVTVDVINGVASDIYPSGTPRQPVNSLYYAHIIALERGFSTIFVNGDLTYDFVPSDHHSAIIIIGQSPTLSTITFTHLTNIDQAIVKNATVEGTIDSSCNLFGCHIDDFDGVDGIIEQCILHRTITLGNGKITHILDCWSGVPGVMTPTVDMNGSGQSLAVRNYNGGIKLINKTGPESVSIDMASGQVIIDNTVTNGTIVLRGIGKWTNRDTYTGGANIIDELVESNDFLSTQEIRDSMKLAPSAGAAIVGSIDAKIDAIPSNVVAEINAQTYDGVKFEDILADLIAMAKGRIVENPSGTFTFYEQDNSTPRFVLVKSGNQRTQL